MLKALAPPAAKVPPNKLQKVKDRSGMPLVAKKSAGTVVTNKSSTTRNFISDIYCFIYR
jgi:hypothetical protein